jgi:hypothetical protein
MYAKSLPYALILLQFALLIGSHLVQAIEITENQTSIEQISFNSIEVGNHSEIAIHPELSLSRFIPHNTKWIKPNTRGGNNLELSPIDSLNLRVVARWPFGRSQAVAVDSSRDLTFMGSAGGIYVLDTSDPTTPVKLTEYPTPGTINKLCFYNEYLYVADGPGGLRIISLSDPEYPSEVASIGRGGEAEDVTVRDSLCYLANGNDGLRIYSITDPTHPVEVGSWVNYASTSDVAVNDSLAVVLAGGGLTVLSISDPENPEELGYSNILETMFMDVAVDSLYAYVLCQALHFWGSGFTGLQVFSLEDPSNPTYIGHASYSYYDLPKVITISDSIAYMGNSYPGLRVFSISDPSHPIEIESFDTPGTSYDMISSRDILYVANWYDGMRIISCEDPSELEEVSYFDVPYWSNAITANHDFAYLACDKGLRVISISDLERPTEIGFVETLGRAMDVVVGGSYAYVAGDREGLRIISIADPEIPVEVGFFDTPGSTREVAIQDSLIYVACFAGGLWIVSISDPDNPYQVGSINLFAKAVAVRGEYAYLASGPVGFTVVSISNPDNPVEVGRYDDYNDAKDIGLRGSHAYLIDGEKGLCVISIADPENPYEVSRFDIPGNAKHMDIRWDIAYVTVSDSIMGNQLKALSIADPEMIEETGYYDTPIGLGDVFVSDSLIFVTMGRSGMITFEYFGPTGILDHGHDETGAPKAFSLSQNYPNPFNPSTTITLDIPRTAGKKELVNLTIYDVRGRRVRTLIDSSLAPGSHKIHWDGLNEKGDSVSSGIYLYQLRAGEETFTRKMVVIR